MSSNFFVTDIHMENSESWHKPTIEEQSFFHLLYRQLSVYHRSLYLVLTNLMRILKSFIMLVPMRSQLFIGNYRLYYYQTNTLYIINQIYQILKMIINTNSSFLLPQLIIPTHNFFHFISQSKLLDSFCFNQALAMFHFNDN